MQDIKEKIIDAVKKASGINDVILDTPENEVFGDYTTNVALTEFAKFQSPSSKHQKNFKFQNPRELAEDLVEKLKTEKKLSEIVGKVEIAGPGFINFWLKNDALVDTLKQIDISKSDFGKTKKGNGKTVIIDYSSPNIAKPFGIGHLRSTIVGQSLYNLYKALGYEVVGDNHLGDWGTQFGKLICMIEMEKLQEFSIENLEKLYVEFHKKAENDPELEEKARECFRKLEAGDPETKAIWQKCVDISIKEFSKVYDLLGVKADFAFGESYYESEMKQMINDPSIRRYLIDGEEGAMVIDLTAYGIDTPLMFLKKDGATTYATRDLATLRFRIRKWDPDIIIYEVGAEQTLHFKQVFAAAKLMGVVQKDTKLVHTAHGLYLAPDGKKFSTRQGKTIKLEDVLDEAIKRARKLQKEDIGDASAEISARQVGIGAIKYFDLMHSVQSNVIFDWEKIMNLEGNSGPYLQYTHARCTSVLAKVSNHKFQDPNKSQITNFDLKNEEKSVLRTLVHFSEIVENAAETFSPNLLCNYLYDLAQKYNHLYNSLKIIGSEAESFRLELTSGVRQVLKTGLEILGIETPQRM